MNIEYTPCLAANCVWNLDDECMRKPDGIIPITKRYEDKQCLFWHPVVCIRGVKV